MTEKQIIALKTKIERLRTIANARRPATPLKCLWPAVGDCSCDKCKKERNTNKTKL